MGQCRDCGRKKCHLQRSGKAISGVRTTFGARGRMVCERQTRKRAGRGKLFADTAADYTARAVFECGLKWRYRARPVINESPVRRQRGNSWQVDLSNI